MIIDRKTLLAGVVAAALASVLNPLTAPSYNWHATGTARNSYGACLLTGVVERGLQPLERPMERIITKLG